MERHKCRLCSRIFSNGRALGGHMRSHLVPLPIPRKTRQLSDLTESASFSSSSSSEDEIIQEPEQEQEEEEEEEEGKGLVYGLRENPKRSSRLADPEFSFTVNAGFAVQDRESETESRNPTRRRFKRTRTAGVVQNQVEKKLKLRKNTKPRLTESQAEAEPVSSVSGTSPDEDVAMCLMMLSRDIWDKSNDNKTTTRSNNFLDDQTGESRNAGNFLVGGVANANGNVKVHECPFCSKVFGSGQALGGHKKSHFLNSKVRTSMAPNCAGMGEFSIDLNLPAPMEDEISQSLHSLMKNSVET